MISAQARDNLDVYKGVGLLFAVVFGLSSMSELLWPGSFPITVGEQAIRPADSWAYYGSLGLGLLISLAGLALFWWLHRRVRLVTASELGLQIMSKPVRGVVWTEVASVKKVLPNLLNGFYLVRLVDGSEFYTPVEPLITWHEAPTSLEQLSKRKGVWI